MRYICTLIPHLHLNGIYLVEGTLRSSVFVLWCWYMGDCSIGSLAKDLEEEGVQNVTVKNAAFTGTQNGLRIKSWARASTGFVKGVHFEGVTMDNVQSPIVIDQNYCPHNQGCPSQVITP